MVLPKLPFIFLMGKNYSIIFTASLTRFKIPVYITALTGINDAMVAVAPGFEEVAGKVFHLLSNKVFVAHNVNFDYSFIKQQLNNCGYELNVKKLCTVRMGRKIFPGLPSYSLGNFCRNMGIIMQNRHRADADARATVELFCIMLLQDGAKGIISKMLKKTSAEQWLPTYLDKNVIDNLPARPGVYYFHDKKNKVIYVGKAINIKKRVSSHFTHNDTDKRRQHFLRFVASVSFTVCASELHALVLESTEIKGFGQNIITAKKGRCSNLGYIVLKMPKVICAWPLTEKRKT